MINVRQTMNLIADIFRKQWVELVFRPLLSLFFLWIAVCQLRAQNTPIVVAYFRPGETYTLCFERVLDYKEYWHNIAQRYNLNTVELLRFNRQNPNQKDAPIKIRTLNIPLIFNVNLFLNQGSEEGIAYLPVYYTIQNKQKVGDLHLRFREPLLSFIKSYNKLSDHHTLNKNAPVFVGYMKVVKSVGWDKAVRDVKTYKTYEQVQTKLRDAANLSQLNQYSVKEKSLVLTEDKINPNAVNAVGVAVPDEQSMQKAMAQINPKQLKEENANFKSFMRRERIEQQQEIRLSKRQKGILVSVGRSSAARRDNKKDKDAGGINVSLVKAAPEKSFFEAEYREDLASGKTEMPQKVRVKLFRLLLDESDGKFYVLANGTDPGTTVKIVNIGARRTIYAKVISATPQSIENKDNTVVISENGAAALKVSDNAKIDMVLLR